MRKDITVVAQPRESRGKNEARRLRMAGKIPAVLYGSGLPARALTVDPKEILKILHSRSGHNTIFNLQADGETTLAMIVDWQFEPVHDRLLHIDFKRIDPTRRVQVSVPLEYVGEARGVKAQGGLLDVVVREIEIECLPDDIPESFVVDVTPLLIGQSKRAGDLELGDNITLLSNPDKVLVHVVSQRGSVTTAPTESAPAEPEVAKKGKKEKEG